MRRILSSNERFQLERLCSGSNEWQKGTLPMAQKTLGQLMQELEVASLLRVQLSRYLELAAPSELPQAQRSSLLRALAKSCELEEELYLLQDSYHLQLAMEQSRNL